MARIGVNALYLIPGVVSGTEIYLRELLAGLARIDSTNQYFVFTNKETGRDLVPEQSNFIWQPQAVRAQFRPGRILWEQTMLPMEAWRLNLDVLFNAGFTAPVIAVCPSVTVFHDLIHLAQPQNFSRFEWPFWRLMLWLAAHRSDRLITHAPAGRADVHRFYGLPMERVSVVPVGVDNAFFNLNRTDIGDYVLCVSALLPHKNHALLIRAYAKRKRDFRLVLVGVRNPYAAQLDALISELGVEDKIEITGWITREALHKLYEGAQALIYPSTFEGFGMPILEGMAAGIPVACSDISPLREISAGATLLFDPNNEDAIASALERIAGDQSLRARLAAEGPIRAREYSWDKTAQLTLDALLSQVKGREALSVSERA